MSWFDAKNFTSFATQAIKTAQKKIDKVLDIEEETADPDVNLPVTPSQPTESDKTPDGAESKSANFSAWSAWGAFGSQQEQSYEQVEKQDTASSFSAEQSPSSSPETASAIKSKIRSRLAKKNAAAQKQSIDVAETESMKLAVDVTKKSEKSTENKQDAIEKSETISFRSSQKIDAISTAPSNLPSKEEEDIGNSSFQLPSSESVINKENIEKETNLDRNKNEMEIIKDETVELESQEVKSNPAGSAVDDQPLTSQLSECDNLKDATVVSSEDLKLDSRLNNFSDRYSVINSDMQIIASTSNDIDCILTVNAEKDHQLLVENIADVSGPSKVDVDFASEENQTSGAEMKETESDKDNQIINKNVCDTGAEIKSWDDSALPEMGVMESFVDVGSDVSKDDFKISENTYISVSHEDEDNGCSNTQAVHSIPDDSFESTFKETSDIKKDGGSTREAESGIEDYQAVEESSLKETSVIKNDGESTCETESSGIENHPAVEETDSELLKAAVNNSSESIDSDIMCGEDDVTTEVIMPEHIDSTDISMESEFTSSEINDLVQNKMLNPMADTEVPLENRQFSQFIVKTDDSSEVLNTSQPLSEDSIPSEFSVENPEMKHSSRSDLVSQETSPILKDIDSSTGNKIVTASKERPSLNSSDSTDTLKLDSSLDTTLSEEAAITIEQKSDHSEESDASAGSSSYVKCLLEEAIEDSKTADHLTKVHSFHSEKSEHVKAESELEKSYYSGHNSSDEIDTTTSSDIEIISTPTSNGEKGNGAPDFSPLRIALSRSKRSSQTRKRNDSFSSSSTNSRVGECEQLSPGRDSLDSSEGNNDQAHKKVDEELDNPYETQKLLKKLAEITEVLQARENKLVQLSKENNDLMENNSILRNQLQQVEEAREAELEDITTLTAEFTDRLSTSDRKLQAAIKERDGLKKQLQTTQDELIKRTKDNTLQNLLKEKDQQLEELMLEGEKLSKQILQNNNIIKKLRSKEKENESLITNSTKKIDEQTKEISHLKTVLDSKEEVEKKQSEAIDQLNTTVQKQEEELIHLRSDQDDHTERIRGMQSALDNSYKEIADLHKSYAARDSQAQEKVLSSEIQLREELKLSMEKEIQQYRMEKEALIMQIEDFRLSMSRMEKEHNRREDLLREEISDLQRKLQEDEMRNQDVTNSVTSATRPLLRQIENLQATYTEQSASWEKIEKNLTDRLADVHNQLAIATEKERHASEKLMELCAKITSFETLTSRLKQEKSQLVAQLEMEKSKVEVLEDHKNSESVKIETVKQELQSQIKTLKKDKLHLETQLEMEKTKLDNEKKRFQAAMEQIKELERENQKSRGTPSPISVSRQESVSDYTEMATSMSGFSQDEIDRSFTLTTGNGNKLSLYESLRQSGASNLLENLQSQIKMREGEILHLQSEITNLERTRESMARELVNLTNQVEELNDQLKELPGLKTEHEELNQRYSAILQMYGEKEEEANELKLDLQDVKEMYKMQIEHLLSK